MSTDAEQKFNRLYEQYHEQVLRFCLRRTHRSDAFDVASDVFVVAWRRIDSVPDGDSALPWLYTVAKGALSNQWRAARRRNRLHGRLRSMVPDVPPEPDILVVRRHEDVIVLEALARLSDSDQEVLRLAAWEGLSVGDISAVIGATPAAVAKRLYRAKVRLAKELGPVGGEVGRASLTLGRRRL